MNFYYAESGIRPSEVDTTSSKTYNYIRRNIREVERIDPDTGEAIIMYVYEECKILKNDWALYICEKENSEGLFDVAALADENSEAIMELAEMIAEMEG